MYLSALGDSIPRALRAVIMLSFRTLSSGPRRGLLLVGDGEEVATVTSLSGRQGARSREPNILNTFFSCMLAVGAFHRGFQRYANNGASAFDFFDRALD